MYSNLGSYYSAFGEFKLSATAFEKSYDLMASYFSGKLDNRDIGLHTPEHGNETGLWLVTVNLANCYANLKDNDTAFKWANLAPMTITKTVDIYFSLINQTGEFRRISDLFDKIAALQNTEEIEKMDMLLTRFNEIVLKNPQANLILQPFFHEYANVVYGYLKRKNLTKEQKEKMHQIHKDVYKLKEATQ